MEEDRLLAEESGAAPSGQGSYDVGFFTRHNSRPTTTAAMLRTGQIIQKAVALNGRVEIRPIMSMSLAFGHGIIDGLQLRSS